MASLVVEHRFCSGLLGVGGGGQRFLGCWAQKFGSFRVAYAAEDRYTSEEACELSRKAISLR